MVWCSLAVVIMVIVTGGRYDTQVPVDEDEDGVVLHVMMDGFIILLDVGPTKVQHITNSKIRSTDLSFPSSCLCRLRTQ